MWPSQSRRRVSPLCYGRSARFTPVALRIQHEYSRIRPRSAQAAYSAEWQLAAELSHGLSLRAPAFAGQTTRNQNHVCGGEHKVLRREGSVQLEALWLELLSARQQLKIELEALGL